MDKNILVITCHKLSDNNGGANASKGFIQTFARLFDDCSLIYPEFDNPTEFIPTKYKLYPCHDSRTKIRKGIDMYLGVVNALYSFVIRHILYHRYDIIVIDHSVTGTSLVKTLKATGAKIITIHHNVEREYLHDNGKERPITFRYPYNFYAKRAEKQCLELSDVNLTLTEKDASVFRLWFPARDIHAHCLGVCEYKDIPMKKFKDKQHSKNFIITGSLNFLQSLKPILEFLNIYYPILEKEYPDCRLTIAGKNPSKKLINTCKATGNISIISNPSDMGIWVEQADYYICPINAGSGIKLRLMDGFKQGLPVLCHSISANGYEDFEHSGYLFPYNDENSFLAALRKMLSDKKPRQDIYNKYRDFFSVDSETERLKTILMLEKII